MNSPEDNKQIAFRYLLGKMSEAEESSFEELYFTDATVLEQLEVAADDLIEDYLGGKLSAVEGELFQTKFLASPAHRQQFEVTKALMQPASLEATKKENDFFAPSTLPKVPWTQSAFQMLRLQNRRLLAAAALFMLLIVGFLLLRGLLNKEPSSPYQAPLANANENNNVNQQRPDFAQPNQNTGNRNSSPSPQNDPDKKTFDEANQIAVFLLTSATKSGDGEKALALADEVKTLRLQIALVDDAYPAYQAIIKSLNGKIIHLQKNLKPTPIKIGSILTLDLPAQQFKAQSYSLQLLGVTHQGKAEEADKYYFRVEKKEKSN